MKKNRFYTYILAAALTFSMGACNDRLDLKPYSSLPPSEALKTVDDAGIAVLGIYERLQELNYYGRDFMVVSEVCADDMLITAANSNRFLSEFQYQFGPTLAAQLGFWLSAYRAIYAANNVITKTPQTTDYDALRGEAYFLRALAHFDLARRYCRPYTNVAAKPNDANSGIPVVVTPFDDPVAFKPKRNTLEETFTQIIADLKLAQNLAPASNGIIRAGKDAATALLVRAYIHKGDWANAITEADKIASKYSLWQPTAVVAAFTADLSSEEIFTLKFVSPEALGADNWGRIHLPNPTGYGDVRPSSTWSALLETGDVRAGQVIVRSGQNYLNKFPGNIAEGQVGMTSVKILRASEVILNRAEAYAETGNLARALADVNALRTRRGLAASTAATIDDVKKEISKQRRLEFIGEGFRTNDMFRKNENRTVTDNNALSKVNVAADNFRVAFPIPISEIDANPNIVQNPGY